MKKVKILLMLFFATIVVMDNYAQEVLAPKPPKYPDGVYTKENTREIGRASCRERV